MFPTKLSISSMTPFSLKPLDLVLICLVRSGSTLTEILGERHPDPPVPPDPPDFQASSLPVKSHPHVGSSSLCSSVSILCLAALPFVKCFKKIIRYVAPFSWCCEDLLYQIYPKDLLSFGITELEYGWGVDECEILSVYVDEVTILPCIEDFVIQGLVPVISSSVSCFADALWELQTLPLESHAETLHLVAWRSPFTEKQSSVTAQLMSYVMQFVSLKFTSSPLMCYTVTLKEPSDPPDPSDPRRLLVTDNGFMVCSRFSPFYSEYGLGFDEWVRLVMLAPRFSGFVPNVLVVLGSPFVAFGIFVAFVRSLTAICRVCFFPGICRYFRLLGRLSPLCDASFETSSANFVAFVPYRTAICRFKSLVTMTDHEFSLTGSSILPISSLEFSGFGTGSSMLKVFPLGVETITIKAALIAASTIEIQHLNVFMDYLSLVKLLKSRNFVNEPESILYGIFCLLGSFSTIFIVYVICTAKH